MRRFIILLVLSIVIVTAGTIYIGSRTFDGLVVDRPYETGLAWDETQRRQERLGWRVILSHDALLQGENKIVIRPVDRKGASLNDATVDVILSRPSTGDYDRTYRARPLRDGRYQVVITLPLAGLWDLRTAVSRGQERYEASERIEAKERAR